MRWILWIKFTNTLLLLTLCCIILLQVLGINSSKSSSDGTKYNSTLIFFHGFGECCNSYKSIFTPVNLPNMNIVIPTADKLQVTFLNGNSTTAWFDYKGTEELKYDDNEGIRHAILVVHDLIDQQIQKGIPSTNIMIGGYDQGGALALISGSMFYEELGGIFALSAWLPCINRFTKSWISKNKCTPIFIGHGENDSVVPISHGIAAFGKLDSVADNVTFKLYRNLAHTIDDREMADVYKFVKKQFFTPVYKLIDTHTTNDTSIEDDGLLS